jgi:flagellar hook-associated protein 1 FlgK
MSGLLGSFNIFRRAMGTQQYAINVTSHNIANANTEGYSMQRATMETTRPENASSLNSTSGPGQLGTGSQVSEISRARDQFLDVQIRNELSTSGRFTARDEFLSEIETMFMEPSYEDGSGLSVLMGKMWDSWQELANAPENSNTRTGVIEATRTMTDSLNHIYDQLEKLKAHSDILTEGKVTDFNKTIAEIEGLNLQISGVKVTGNNPNDLLDKQDLLIDKIAEMADIEVKRDDLGQVTIWTSSQSGSVKIVGTDKQSLKFDKSNPDRLSWVAADKTEIPAGLYDGSIKGYVSVTADINAYQDKLNAMAKAIAYAINTVQNGGSPGEVTGYTPMLVAKGDTTSDTEANITAQNITVNPNFVKDPTLVKAGVDDKTSPGDGSRALGISQIRDKRLLIDSIGSTNTMEFDADNMTVTDDPNGTTLDGYYGNLIIEIGSDARQAASMVTGQEELLNQLYVRKESVSGVSIDEETANLIIYQHAFNAAAKGVSIIDELLDTVVNGLIR